MHECSEAKDRGYEIRIGSETNPCNYIYDRQAHGYIFDIHFCPFCGEAL